MNINKEKTYISTNLKYLRSKKGKSLNDIATICNKTDAAIHYWENGTREPNVFDITKLANYFDISVDDLLSKDLRLINNKQSDEFDILFSKYKNILTDDDKEYMKFIIERRKREIDKRLEDN